MSVLDSFRNWSFPVEVDGELLYFHPVGAKCAGCSGQLIGDEVRFGTCGHCGGRSSRGAGLSSSSRPGEPFKGPAMMPAGSINAWKCDVCGRLTVARHVDDGVTPMFLACRASGRVEDCGGTAVSSGYPSSPIPKEVLDRLEWEWYRPGKRATRRLEPAMQSHVAGGGLVLRRIRVAS